MYPRELHKHSAESCRSYLKCCAVCIAPFFLFCLDIHTSLLSDPQQYSYEFPGKTQDVIFTVSLAVLAQQGYTISFSDRQAGIIRAAEPGITLSDGDCDCVAEGELPYSKKQKTTTRFSFTVSITGHRVTITTAITREYLPDDPAYGTKFTCVSRGTIENDILSKIAEGLRSAF
ncbi:MAG: hypothetical protein ABSF80_12310 [Chitinispirillaceae bacterium]|jgi:hypothetical protein